LGIAGFTIFEDIPKLHQKLDLGNGKQIHPQNQNGELFGYPFDKIEISLFYFKNIRIFLK